MARLDPAVAQIRNAVRLGLADLEPGARILVACSGGADSLALTEATLCIAGHTAWSVGAVVVDHGLQPDSATVATRVAEIAKGLGCDPVHVVAVAVGHEGGPEGAARAARYAALDAYDVEAVLLGHTRDDQAETVLLGLSRGSGVRSVAGMRAVSGRYRRPLLDIPRSATRRYCAALGLPVWDDPHNIDPTYKRVRVRSEVLPLLDDVLGPGVVDALARTGELARRDADALDAWAHQVYDDITTGPSSSRPGTVRADSSATRGSSVDASSKPSLDIDALDDLPIAVQCRVVRTAAIEAGCPQQELTAGHVDAVLRLVDAWHGQDGVDLPGHIRAMRHERLLVFHPAARGAS
jgi:tRNA(Ile)-lysidine synthase